MYLMIAADLALIPLALIHHPRPASIAAGLIPAAVHGAGASSTALLLVALIGSTIVPWQLFFQQSTVADKRITSRWLSYERADTAIGAVLFAACAGAVLILSATALSRTPLRGHFTDVGAVTDAIGLHLGSVAGAIFAIALLNASLLCAAAVSLSGSFAIAEVLGVRHSLHHTYRDAKTFHASFAAIVALAAGVVLIPGLPLGTLTTLVQALAGILLPSTLVLLLILANDKQLLGNLTNGRWQNATTGAIVVAILALSTMLTITTVLPRVDLWLALLATAALLLAGAIALGASVRPASPTRPRVLALALLRGYILLIAGLLALKLAGLLPP